MISRYFSVFLILINIILSRIDYFYKSKKEKEIKEKSKLCELEWYPHNISFFISKLFLENEKGKRNKKIKA